MSFLLRKSTAGQVVQFKMVDATTALKKTGLTIANTDIKLIFEAGTTQTSKNSGGATEIGSTGVYYMTLDATDSATLGRLRIDIEVSGALPWFADLMVMTAASWDALYAASGGFIPADVTKLLGTAWLTPGTAGTPDVNAKLLGATAQTGRDLGASVLLATGTGTGQLDFTAGVVKANVTQSLGVAVTNYDGQATAGGASTLTFDSSTGSTVDDFYNGQWVWIVGGLGIGQRRLVVNYVGSTKVATVHRPWAVNPDSTSKYIMEAGFDFLGTCGSVNDASATTTGFVSTLTGYGDDFFKGAFLVFLDGALRGEARKISGYTSSTGAIAFAATVGTVANSVPFMILGRSE